MFSLVQYKSRVQSGGMGKEDFTTGLIKGVDKTRLALLIFTASSHYHNVSDIQISTSIILKAFMCDVSYIRIAES